MAKRGVSKSQWIEEALHVLKSDGIDGVRIGRLATRLGIARSGFYWHFTDHRDLLDHLLEYWAHEYTEVVLRDPETDQTVLLNTRNNALRNKWRIHRAEQRDRLTDLLKRTGVDLVEITTDGSVYEPLVRLFDKRRKRR